MKRKPKIQTSKTYVVCRDGVLRHIEDATRIQKPLNPTADSTAGNNVTDTVIPVFCLKFPQSERQRKHVANPKQSRKR